MIHVTEMKIPNYIGEIYVEKKPSVTFFAILEMVVFLYYLYAVFFASEITVQQAWFDVGIFCISMVAITVIHELSHYIPARVLGYEAYIDWWETTCNFEEELRRNHFLLIAIMPSVVITIIAVIAKILFPHFIFIIPAYLLKVFGCRNDLILFFKAFRFPKDSLLFQAKDRSGYFLVFKEKERAA